MKEGRQFAARQSQGDRPYQEDDWGYVSRLNEADEAPHGLLVVLADGMGGHRGGAYASAAAVETFIKAFSERSEPVPERLRLALEGSNRRIGNDGGSRAELEGMGCTLVAVDFSEEGMHWISVGDSPLWLLRDGELRRLNEDHSMAPVLKRHVEIGDMTEDEAACHPQRNALRSALVGEELALVDLSSEPLKLREGDRVLLSSDGLETLSEEEIVGIAAEATAPASQLAARLVDAVDQKQRQGQDNTTVVVVSPFTKDAAGKARRRLLTVLTVLLLLLAGTAAGFYLFGDTMAGGVTAPLDSGAASDGSGS